MASYDEVMKRATKDYGKPLPVTPPKPPQPKPPAPPGPKSLKRAAAAASPTGNDAAAYKERTQTEQTLEPGMRPGYKNLAKGPSSWKGDYFQGGSRGSR